VTEAAIRSRQTRARERLEWLYTYDATAIEV